MKSFHDLIMQRRSIRKFTDEPLSKDDVATLLSAALMSPSSKRSTGWQFIVVDEKDTLKKLSECRAMGSAFLENVALAVVVTADPSVSDVWIEDASIAMLMMQLQAEDLGLGSCWMQVRQRMAPGGEITADEYIHELLDLPEELRTLAILGVGHKAQERKPFDPDKLLWEKVHLNKFGGK